MQKLVKKATDKHGHALGPRLVRAGRPRRQRQPQLHARRRRDARDAGLSARVRDGRHDAAGPEHHLAEHAIPPCSPKGRVSGQPRRTRTCGAGSRSRNIQYPLIEYLSALKSKPLFLGVESVVAGHEHSSMSVITGQMPASIFNADAADEPGLLAARQCHGARASGSTASIAATPTRAAATPSVGGTEGNNWDCSVAGQRRTRRIRAGMPSRRS